MKINFKHVATAALAVAMSLSLASPALAEGPGATPTPVTSGDLTVTGDQLAGKKVTAIRMFTARATVGAAVSGESYDFDSYVLEDKWVPFFATEDMQTELTKADRELDLPTKPTEDDNDNYPEELAAYNAAYSDAAVVYLQWLETQSDKALVPNFAEAAQDWAVSTQNATSLADLTKTETATQVDDTTTGSATFSGLTAGYYLVFPEMGGTGNANVSVGINPEGSRGTDAMLINIPTNTTWNIKSTYPTVEKKVDDGNTATPNDEDKDNADNGSAQVGDVVTFTLTSAVPDTSDYKTYVFQFTDKLPSGLTLVHKNDSTAITQNTEFTVGDITLKINGNAVKATNVTVALDDGSGADGGKKILTVKINDLKAKDLLESGSFREGDKIVLTYQAMINENAVTTDSVTNEASVQYSNDPTGTGLGTSTPDESTVYTYDINVDKWASDISTTNLAGAQFQLTRDKAGDDVVNLIATDETDSEDATDLHNAYRVAKPGEESEEGYTTTFTTDDDGNINIAGLEAGTYYLHEVAAPTGYNKLKAPLEIKIIVDKETAATYAPAEESGEYNDVSFEKPLYVVDKKPNTTNNDTIKVENKKGIELPETGSIGTIGLTVAGVAIVLLGVFAPRKKKGNQE